MIVEAATIKCAVDSTPPALINKAKSKFNISIPEVDAQDIHQTIELKQV